LLVIVGLAAGALHAGAGPAAPVITLGACYLAVAATVLAGTGAASHATALAFGLPALTFLTDRPVGALLLTLGLYVVGFLGMRRSLAAFPWRDPKEEKVHPSTRPPRWLPWPGSEVGPLAPKPPLRRGKALLVSAMIGWWVYAALGHPATAVWFGQQLHKVDRLVFAAAIGVIFAVVRWLNYALGRWAPISLYGRLRYGPLLIPRYDVIHLAPLCTALAACAVPFALRAAGVGVIESFAATVAISLALALTLPPSKYQWKLTGAYQVLGMRKRRNPAAEAQAGEPALV
jgi:hypothetical protein